jgi:SAM-dependent methyltransferase
LLYKDRSYSARDKLTRQSAEVIVPIVLDIIPVLSAVDVGCGVGTWLSVFQKYGVKEIFGIEGNWVPKKYLVIEEKNFLNHDLNKPLKLGKKFDLAISLEVAEHIPASNTLLFIDTLTSLAPAILFSAAIPGQGGIGHVNEQWPDYWVEMFGKKGYESVDIIRRKIWNEKRVAWWYAQNTLLFLRKETLLNIHLERSDENQILRVIHPGNYENVLKRSTWTFLLKKTIKSILHLKR